MSKAPKMTTECIERVVATLGRMPVNTGTSGRSIYQIMVRDLHRHFGVPTPKGMGKQRAKNIIAAFGRTGALPENKSQPGKPRIAAPGPRKASKVIHLRPVALPDGMNAEFIASNEFLQSYEWRKLRMDVLRHYGPVCMCCGASPKNGAVMNVDHVMSRRRCPELALNFNNLQVLCGPCNHGKGNEDHDWRPRRSRSEIDKAEAAADQQLVAEHPWLRAPVSDVDRMGGSAPGADPISRVTAP